MKKIILLLVSYILCFDSVFSQEIEWAKCLGGSNWDDARGLYHTADGGCIVSGYTMSPNDGNVTGNHGFMDFWVVKLDINGTIEWQKCYGGTNGDVAYSIKSTNDGGYIVAGTTGSSDGDVTSNNGTEDVWVVKIDSVGTLQWQHNYGGSYTDMGYKIIQTSDGGYFVAGESESNDFDVTGHHGSTYPDMWCLKLDGSGNLQWQKSLGGTDYDRAYTAVQADDGGYLVCGYTESSDGDVTGLHGGADIWIVKLDSLGNIEWQKCLGGSANDGGMSAIKCSSSGYAVFGFTYSNNGDVTGNHGGVDAWIVRLDTSGNILWEKSIGGTGNDSPVDGLQLADGGFVVAARSYSCDTLIPVNRGGLDYWVFKTDSIGNVLWQKTYGGTDDDGDQYMNIAETVNHDLIISGSVYSRNIDISGLHGPTSDRDYWVVKLTDRYNTITGNAFIDLNSNTVFDSNETPVSTHEIKETSSGREAFSYSTGFYDLSVLGSGNFTAEPAPVNYYTSVPATQPVYFPSINQVDSLNDFAFQPAGVFNDICVSITPMAGFSPGFNSYYTINYENFGTTSLNGTVIFFPDNDVTFVSSNPVATSVTADSIVWNVGTLTPFQSGTILVTVNENIGTPDGTVINSMVRMEPIAGDANPACNYDEWESYSESSYDPNEILVDRDTVYTAELSNPPYLNYIIYFQNTGTASCINARVLNNLPQKADINTFEFVASSHPVNISYSAYSRLITFTFDNILLPDSTANEPASHGFVRYRIKPKTTLNVGDSIRNKVYIYFDFNPPVMTNTAMTEIVLPTGEQEFEGQRSKLKAYPNPVRDELIVNSYSLTGKKAEIIIFDLFGREVFQLQTLNLEPQTKIDISRFSQGVYFLNIKGNGESYTKKIVKIGER